MQYYYPVMEHCIICGASLLDSQPENPSSSWLREYRLVYRHGCEARLSGAGLGGWPASGRYGSYAAPIDETKTWSDEGVQFENLEGIVFHESCWRVLNERSRGRFLSVERIMDVFDSIQEDDHNFRLYRWEHGYNGIVKQNESLGFPFSEAYKGWEIQGHDSHVVQSSFTNPCLPEAVEFFDNYKPVRPPSRRPIASKGQYDRKHGFNRLPCELIEEIASYLPTTTVLQLRLVSRAFVFIFDSQYFWAGKFQPDAERGFMEEAVYQKFTKDCDWRSLYVSTGDSKLSPQLQNRKRIWDLSGVILQLTELKWVGSSSLTDSPIQLPKSGEIQVSSLPGLEHHKGPPSNPQKTIVPSMISRIGASIVQIGDVSYVTGICFTSREGRTVSLGYFTPTTTTYTDVHGVKGIIPSTGLWGICAIQILNADDNTLSPWLGCPSRGAKTRRLCFDEPISGISARFDGFKMFIISAWGKRNPIPKRLQRHNVFLNHALWSPDFPQPYQILNKGYFGRWPTGSLFHPDEFEPIYHTSFGGPRGAYLRFLVQIAVEFCKYGGSIISIKFSYNCSEVPKDSREHRFRYYADFADSGSIETKYFKIDGPDGELIESFEVKKHEDLDYLKVGVSIIVPKTIHKTDRFLLLRCLQTGVKVLNSPQQLLNIPQQRNAKMNINVFVLPQEPSLRGSSL
ncbi:hypothetical protein FQN55_002747 [Onygenales sp. PD_40]|nr:hypothetical protein FQN55_002747 [Onygenales sp. PD_40]